MVKPLSIFSHIAFIKARNPGDWKSIDPRLYVIQYLVK